MRLPCFDHIKPESLEVSLAFLEKSGKKARLLGGGTDLLVSMKYGLSRPDTLISLKGLPELSGITADNHGNIVIGAGVTLSNLAKNPIISEKIPVLKKAVLSVASKHIRNMATIGGNICLDTRCWYYNQSKLWREAREVCHKTGGSVCHAIKGSDRCHAINSSDTAPILAALNASVRVVKKGGERLIFIKDFSAKDYYSLVKTSSEIRIFTIEEACIPLGLLAISYEKGYGEKQARDYTQAVILKLISRNASYTLYTLEDLRTACSEYRKDISDD